MNTNGVIDKISSLQGRCNEILSIHDIIRCLESRPKYIDPLPDYVNLLTKYIHKTFPRHTPVSIDQICTIQHDVTLGKVESVLQTHILSPLIWLAEPLRSEKDLAKAKNGAEFTRYTHHDDLRTIASLLGRFFKSKFDEYVGDYRPHVTIDLEFNIKYFKMVGFKCIPEKLTVKFSMIYSHGELVYFGSGVYP